MKKYNIFKRKCLQVSTLSLKLLNYPVIYQTLYHEYYFTSNLHTINCYNINNKFHCTLIVYMLTTNDK